MNISVKTLSPDLLNDYLSFFDNMEFTENPHWSKCYCYSFHFTGPNEEWTRENNRLAVSKLIKENKLRGFLAYSGNTVVGWCNANDRNNYQALTSTYEIDKQANEKIYSIVCFLISPEQRGKGIASLLMKEVIEKSTLAGYAYLEAYPEKASSSCERNYKGPLKLYESYGFKVVAEHDEYYVVRKTLN